MMAGNMILRLSVAALVGFIAFGGSREVAITIDDLPRAGDLGGATSADTLRMTSKLLAPFREGKIPVIGFVNECSRPDVLRDVLLLWRASGADLGNHTCSHQSVNSIPVEAYEADVVRGETVTTAVLGDRPSWFRHPFLHTGSEPVTKAHLADFLVGRGYRIAPVTLDNNDYMFAAVYARALQRGDTATAARVREAYVPYLASIFEYFEKRSVEVTGHEVRQVLLIHANQLNADSMPDLLSMIANRGYTFVNLARALEDPAYRLPENYAGKRGLSWIHRWALTQGLPATSEPDEPAWLTELYSH